MVRHGALGRRPRPDHHRKGARRRYPIAGGVTGRQDIMDAVHPSGGATFGGNPTACRAGLAVFEIIESEGLLDRAAVVGERIRARFQALQKHYPVIGDVRGIGGMAAMELVEDPATKKPAGALAKTFRAKLYENGVVNVGAGTYHNVVRFLVPLTIEDEVLARGLDIVEETLAQVVDAARPRRTTKQNDHRRSQPSARG